MADEPEDDVEKQDKEDEKEEAKEASRDARPRPTPRQSFQRFILIFLGIMALYVLIFQDVSRSFGQS